MNTSGGYDFNIVGQLVKEYECPICLLLIKDAIELPCTHALCKTCLHTWENEPSDSSALLCPSCKAVYQKVQIQQSKILDRIITTSLQVQCRESQNRCQWIGTISDYKDHENKCLFQIIKCDLFGCEERVIRSFIEEHKMMCSFRLVYCSYCGEEEQFRNLEVHYQSCTSYPVTCLNKECDVAMVRKELEAHIFNTCDFQVVKCEYESVRCNFKGHRKDLQIHLDTSVHQHMNLLLTHTTVCLTTTEKKLETTAENLRLTTEKLNNTKVELEDTKNELKTTIQKFEEKTMKIEENCMQSTKLLAIHTKKLTIPIEIENSFEDRIKVLPDEEWKEYKKEHDDQQKELDIESLLEKYFTIQIVDKSNQQHIELLKGIKRTWIIETNITEVPYPVRFNKLLHSMGTYQLYYHNNNEIYVKVNLKKYVGQMLGVYMYDISERNSLQNDPNTKYYSDEICLLSYNTDIRVFFLIPNWNNYNTNLFIINPQLDEKIQNGISNGSHRFYDKLQQRYLSSDGEILMTLNKM